MQKKIRVYCQILKKKKKKINNSRKQLMKSIEKTSKEQCAEGIIASKTGISF